MVTGIEKDDQHPALADGLTHTVMTNTFWRNIQMRRGSSLPAPASLSVYFLLPALSFLCPTSSAFLASPRPSQAAAGGLGNTLQHCTGWSWAKLRQQRASSLDRGTHDHLMTLTTQ